jgi:hypothetical protein
MLPVCLNRRAHLTTLLTAVLNCFAAARLAPAPTAATTRVRRSSELGFVIHAGLHPSQHFES